MVQLISPGITFTEQDQTLSPVASGTTLGGFVGSFSWGAVLDITDISSENELVASFGKRTTNTFVSFFTAANFLSYGSSLKNVRVVGTGATNASSKPVATFSGNGTLTNFTLPYAPISVTSIIVKVGGVVQTPTTAYTVSGTTLTFTTAPTTGTNNVTVTEKQLIKNETHFSTLTGLVSSVYAKYAGEYGNSLKVILADSTSFTSLSTGEKALFSDTPTGTEIMFAVIDEDGVFSGTAGTLLEKKEFLSTVSTDKFDTGESKYYKTYINRTSKYIVSTGTITDFSTGKASLVNGVSDDALTDAMFQAGAGLFADSQLAPVSLFMCGGVSSTSAAYAIQNIANVRKDLLVFVSPDMDSVVNNSGEEVNDIKTYRTACGSSSYAVMDSGWKYQYDVYNDTYRWIPLNGDIAGLCVNADLVSDPWVSPAGYNRGYIKNVVKLAWNPNKSQRDELQKVYVNPVITEIGQGTLLLGDKTLVSRPSSFDSISVRRLFIYVEQAINNAAKFVLFEFNDEVTRANLKNSIEPFLRDVQGRRGIIEFKVVCDKTNNTSGVIDTYNLVADIFIKPNKPARYIKLNYIATRDSITLQSITTL